MKRFRAAADGMVDNMSGTVVFLHGRYSYPSGYGPDKVFGYLDLTLLAEVAEAEGVDFRVLYLRRPARDTVLADTVHREFHKWLDSSPRNPKPADPEHHTTEEGQFMRYMQILFTNIAVVHSFLGEMDPAFIVIQVFKAMRSRGILAASLAVWVAPLDSGSAAKGGNAQLETTLPMDAATFARLALSQEFYRSNRATGDFAKQEVVDLGEWVPWESQSADQGSPSNPDNGNEAVPKPNPSNAGAVLSCMKGGGVHGALVHGMPGAAIPGEEQRADIGDGVEPNRQASSIVFLDAAKASRPGPQQMLHWMRHVHAPVASSLRPLPASAGGGNGSDQIARIVAAQAFFSNVARRTGPFLHLLKFRYPQGVAQGQEASQMYRKVRLRLCEGENEVIYTETDCISGLPMFRGDLVVKTTYRVTRDEDDPNNSVRVKVTVAVGDVKLARAVGWLSRRVKMVIRDTGEKQAAKILQSMVEAKTTHGW
eukprot:g10178.t1